MPVVTIPKGIRDLTSEWLTAALADVTDGARVTDLVAMRVGNGNIADSVRLVPMWDRPTPNLQSLVAKVPSSEEVSRATGFATRTYELEAAFYNELAPTVWVNRPTCYLARFDPEAEAYVVLMEDLSPAEAGDQIEGCEPEDAAAVIPELAALHAPRWGDPSLLALDWLARPLQEAVDGVVQLASMLFPGFLERYRDRLDPGVEALCHRLVKSLVGYLLDRPGEWTVVHGDFRLDNVLFGGPRVAVVDWQTIKIGPGLSDVSYFIGSALHPDDRRQAESDLVREYHRAMRVAGVDLSWSDCWTGYCRYSLDGLLMAIIASMLVTRTPRSDDMFMAMANRHGHQALDLNAADFL